MTSRPKILVFAGSAREASLNKKLARAAAKVIDENGGEATFIDLRDYPMPIYEGDLEAREGMPPFARKLRELFVSHPAFLIVSPENNGTIPSLLKNAIDWLSRDVDGKSGLEPYRGKVIALMSASPGAFGGVVCLTHLRFSLSKLLAHVIPDQFPLPKADQAFAEDGSLLQAWQQKSVLTVVRQLIETTSRLAA
ncbi:MAG TPA: NAD(P)H-dependent oxidoreductase [Vicinamibacteria bacterium]|nr:NAD(P)H-dependent oxidoreductase [Vicinamibacteria bacterium]